MKERDKQFKIKINLRYKKKIKIQNKIKEIKLEPSIIDLTEFIFIFIHLLYNQSKLRL